MNLIEELLMDPRERRKRNEDLVDQALASYEWKPVGALTWEELARRMDGGEIRVMAVDVYCAEGSAIGTIQVFVERSL